MAQIFLDAADYADGTTLEDLGFVGNANAGAGTYTVTTVDGVKVFRASTGVDRRAWIYDVAAASNASEVLLIKGPSSNGSWLSTWHAHQSAAVTGYEAKHGGGANNATIVEVTANSSAQLASGGSALTATEHNVLRTRFRYGKIHLKSWVTADPLKAADDEPDAWLLTVSDTTIASGKPAIGATAEQPFDIRFIGIGTGGDVAPSLKDRGQFKNIKTSANYATGVTDYTVTIPGAAGSNRVFVAAVSEARNPLSVSGASLNGVAGTEVTRVEELNDGSTRTILWMWLDANLPATAGDYLLDIAHFDSGERKAGTFYAEGARQVIPTIIDTANGISGSGANTHLLEADLSAAPMESVFIFSLAMISFTDLYSGPKQIDALDDQDGSYDHHLTWSIETPYPRVGSASGESKTHVLAGFNIEPLYRSYKFSNPTAAGTNSFSATVLDRPDRFLMLAFRHDGTFTPTTVNYGGQEMTLMKSHTSSGDFKLYGLVNPAVGTADVTIAGTSLALQGAVARCYYGINPDNPYNTVTDAFASGAVTVPANVGETAILIRSDEGTSARLYQVTTPSNAFTRENIREPNANSAIMGWFDAVAETVDPVFTLESENAASNSPRNFMVSLNPTPTATGPATPTGMVTTNITSIGARFEWVDG